MGKRAFIISHNGKTKKKSKINKIHCFCNEMRSTSSTCCVPVSLNKANCRATCWKNVIWFSRDCIFTLTVSWFIVSLHLYEFPVYCHEYTFFVQRNPKTEVTTLAIPLIKHWTLKRLWKCPFYTKKSHLLSSIYYIQIMPLKKLPTV